LLLLLSVARVIAQPGLIERTLPRAANAGEAVWARIAAGALPRGARIRVSTPDGVSIGSVGPFGTRRGQEAASYDVVLPAGAIQGNRVRLRLEIIEPGGTLRAPGAGEIDGVELRYVPVTR
jgi:hypothetical protein